MCGIVGYTGKSEACGILIDGLKRLEYRGYDSAGLCLNGESLTTIKAIGKVKNLADKTHQEGLKLKSTTGIAHTRWATTERLWKERTPASGLQRGNRRRP